MDKVALLQRIAAEADAPWLTKPFGVVVNDQVWSVATDRRMILGFPSLLPGLNALTPGNKAYGDLISDALTIALLAHKSYRLEGLRNFAGTPARSTRGPCPICKGTGKACTCGECKCSECTGGKINLIAPVRLGFVLDRLCDINRVAQVLADLPDSKCRIDVSRGELAPIGFAGDGWSGVVMPVKLDNAEQARTYPRWNG